MKRFVLSEIWLVALVCLLLGWSRNSLACTPDVHADNSIAAAGAPSMDAAAAPDSSAPVPAAPAPHGSDERAGGLTTGGLTGTQAALRTNFDFVDIPRLKTAPKLSDFLGPKLMSPEARKMLRIDKFIQNSPKDGAAATEPTVAYLGYTHEAIFAVFVCKDSHPNLIRAHLLQRDSLSDDDYVEIMLDTYDDARRAFLFKSNPLGIQADALYTEQQGSDYSFDTVWDTWGKLLPDGYAVMMRIPFASLTFKHAAPGERRTWGMVLQRGITRKSESDFWPRIKQNIAGRLTQDIDVRGFRDITGGKNLQFEPYILGHNVHELNTTVPLNPHFNNKNLQGYAGLDTKFILHNSLVLDMTFNPDFSQIGIDNPAPPNQRFAYQYPELRPFFIENSSYFATPFDLYYTPGIVMPQFGQRLTGKLGPWALALLNVDDREPGLAVPQSSPDYGTRSHTDIGRVNRDIGEQSNVGVIYANWQYLGSFNRNGGIDYRTQLKHRWTLKGQAVTSETAIQGSPWRSGQAYVQQVTYSDLHNYGWAQYSDIAAGYTTETGFLTRADIREPNGYYSHTFRPKHGPLLSHGPNVYFERIWDHNGLPLDYYIDPQYSFNFTHRTSGSVFLNSGWDRLRPIDYPVLTHNVSYPTRQGGASVYTSPVPWLALGLTGYAGEEVNYEPPANRGPQPVNSQTWNGNVEVKPLQSLDLLNTYQFNRYVDPASSTVAYETHQLVSRWNLQMNKAWSVRLIGEYLSTLPNPKYTDLADSREIYGDALLTYEPHPGTAFYLGYTTDFQNLNPDLCTRESNGLCNPAKPILPTVESSLLDDERVVYMKVNYLFRF